jgi:NAD-dependent DNA ligase
MENLLKIKKNKKVISKLTKEELKECIQVASDAYFNENSIIEDELFDLLVEEKEKKDPLEKEEIGSIPKNKKINLPYEMFSMNKIKNNPEKIKRFVNKYSSHYVISNKLDGVSALYIKEDTKEMLYTRGNGKIGQDISFLLKFLILPTQKKNVVLRGELIISKNKFEKYKNEYSSGRQFVVSMVNSLEPNPEYLKEIDLVFYEVIKPLLNPLDQMEWLKNNNYLYSIYNNELFQKNINVDYLSEYLLLQKVSYEYEIDGIIIIHNAIYPRKSKNPEHAFAFKIEMEYQLETSTVVDVVWNVSKDGYLKPKIRIKPVMINNHSIEYVSGYNGYYIESNKIGKGAKVEIMLSGDVIPVIRTILEPAQELCFPEEYIWDEKHVEISIVNKDNKEFRIKEMYHFFKQLDIDKLGVSYITKMYDNGYDSIEKILLIKEEELKELKNITQKTALYFYEKIKERMKTISLKELLIYSNILGKGYSLKKIDSLLEQYPDFLDKTKTIEIKKCSGFSENSILFIKEKLPLFYEFLKKIKV